MGEKEELFKALDKVMDLQHRIVNSIMKMAAAEVKREPVREIEQQLLLKEVERLAGYYSEVRELANEYKDVKYKDSVPSFEAQTTALTAEESKTARSDDGIVLDVRQEMLDYIQESYADMAYISVLDEDIISIYDGSDEEHMRLLEYESYAQNFMVLEHKDMFDDFEGDYKLLPFWARASIIEELANTDSYTASLKAVTRVADSLGKDGTYDKLLPEEKEELRKRMIYKKYEELYLFLNQKYNGLLTPEMHITGAVEAAQKTGALNMFLGVTSDEFSLNHDTKVLEYVEGIKAEMNEDLYDVTRDRRSIKVKPRRVTAKDVKEKIQSLSQEKLGKKKTNKTSDKKENSKGKRKDKKSRLKDGTIINVSFIHPGSNNGDGSGRKGSGAPDFDDDTGLR